MHARSRFRIRPQWVAGLLVVAVLGGAHATPPAAPGATETARAKQKCVLKKKAKCKKATLTKVKVGKKNLAGANLAGASITGATFTGTNLNGVNLTGAVVRNTTFTNVSVTNLDLSRARLSGVRFVGVRSSGAGQSAQAREAACEPAPEAERVRDIFTAFRCTGGGVMARNAVLRNTVFVRSVIPGSRFDDSTFIMDERPGIATEPEFAGTQVDRSSFERSEGASFRPLVASGRLDRSSVVGSIFDGAIGVDMAGTDATDASFAGTAFASSEKPALAAGARGLQGVTTVQLVKAADDATSASGLVTATVREDGYFRPGMFCTSLPCTYAAAAIGAPGKAVVTGTNPMDVVMPGWTCGAPAPTGRTEAAWSTTCTVAAIPAGASEGVVRRQITPAPETTTVTVNARDAFTLQPLALSWIRIETVSAAGAVLDATSCYGQTSCVKTVTKGARARVMMMNTTGTLVGWCTADATMFTGSAPPNSEYTCPDIDVNAALVATVQVS